MLDIPSQTHAANSGRIQYDMPNMARFVVRNSWCDEVLLRVQVGGGSVWIAQIGSRERNCGRRFTEECGESCGSYLKTQEAGCMPQCPVEESNYAFPVMSWYSHR